MTRIDAFQNALKAHPTRGTLEEFMREEVPFNFRLSGLGTDQTDEVLDALSEYADEYTDGVRDECEERLHRMDMQEWAEYCADHADTPSLDVSAGYAS